jgi:hypothetical protein
MHVLEYLSDPQSRKEPKNSLTAEYRLLCSGTLHHACLGDYSKSEGARILLNHPLRLFVVSRPFDDYPLELALQLTVPLAEESEQTRLGSMTYSFHADDEVARDVAALLCLLCRRLITVAGKASERHLDNPHVLFGEQPFPLPLATSMRRVFWRPHPMMVLTSITGQELENYNPRPKAVVARDLTGLLLALPSVPHAKSLVTACRLYAVALELIHDRPDIAYQLLISSVETIANSVFGDFQPADEVKLEHQNGLYEFALGLRLDKETARALAIEACRREWWATKKFKKFLTDYVSEAVWSQPDELFHRVHQEVMPKGADFERTLGKIYAARSKATHQGQAFPHSASYTGGPYLTVRASTALYATESPFPPVVWFERVVNSALSSYWHRSLPTPPGVAADATAQPSGG